MMISKNRQKLLRQLETKKYRDREGLFVAEGPKVISDLLAISSAKSIYATRQWIESHGSPSTEELIEVTPEELRRISFLQHPQQVLGVFPLPSCTEPREESVEAISSTLCLGLDGVRDPGNLGTIIRIADWFGIEHIYCSEDCADAYSPKVIQATMGSIARVRVVYTDLCELCGHLPSGVAVYGTLLDGTDIYQSALSSTGLLVMGNEGHGISQPLRERLTHRLLIPAYPPDRPTAESLNVAIATAVCCAEFRKRM